jgi:plasmid stabilization system protein ParE
MNPYSLSVPARLDLMGIREYLRTAPRPIQAKVLAEINEGFRQISDFPLSGRKEPAFSSERAGSVRSLLMFPYRIFYRAETSPVLIVAILHGAQDIPSILRGRANPSGNPLT